MTFNLDIVKLLLEAKANVNIIDNKGYEALRWAYHNAQMDSTNINSIKIVRIIEPYKIKSKFFGSKFFKIPQ